jgi:hypothetical protein
MLVLGHSSKIDSKLSFLKVDEEEELDISQLINPEQKSWQTNARKVKSLIIPKRSQSFVLE